MCGFSARSLAWGISESTMGKEYQQTSGEAGQRPPHARKPVPNAEVVWALGLNQGGHLH